MVLDNKKDNLITDMEEKMNLNSTDFDTNGSFREKSKLDINIDAKSIKETLLNFVVPLVAVLISIIIIVFAVYPLFKKYPDLKQEFDSKTVLRRSLQNKISNLRKLVDFKEFVDEGSSLVSSVLVSEPEVPKLLDQVHQIATNSGMSIDRLSYSYGGEQTSTSYSTVVISLGAETNYDQVLTFMESVENAARFLEVPSFRYSLGRGSEDGSVLSANFSIDSPYLFVQSDAVTDDPVNLDISSQEFVDFINMIKGLRYYEFLNIQVNAVEENTDQDEVKEEVGLGSVIESSEEVEQTE